MNETTNVVRLERHQDNDERQPIPLQVKVLNKHVFVWLRRGGEQSAVPRLKKPLVSYPLRSKPKSTEGLERYCMPLACWWDGSKQESVVENRLWRTRKMSWLSHWKKVRNADGSFTLVSWGV